MGGELLTDPNADLAALQQGLGSGCPYSSRKEVDHNSKPPSRELRKHHERDHCTRKQLKRGANKYGIRTRFPCLFELEVAAACLVAA